MLLFALDRFPVELIYLIYEYLSGDDILYSFLHTSAYMNEILESYDEFPLNLIGSFHMLNQIEFFLSLLSTENSLLVQ